MPNSVHLDPNGPDWPLGFIGVSAPGTPVSIMANVDPGFVNTPENPTGPQVGEFTVRAEEIMVQAMKPANPGMTLNSGNIYIVRKGVGAGTGNRADTGAMVIAIQPGQTYFLNASAQNRNVFSPYRYYIDADNVGDGALVTLVIQ